MDRQATSAMNRRHLLMLGAAGAFFARPAHAGPADPWDQVPAILARIKPPVFADRDYVITAYGAAPDADCTAAFAAAIAACNAAGGGRVAVPPGTWMTGAIHLKSNVNLHLADGAVVKFSADPKHYPIVHTFWEGNELMNYSPFIYAFEQENIAITGKGTLDGQADATHWWDWRIQAFTGGARKRLQQMGEDNVVVEKRVFGDGDFLRPQFVQPVRCNNVLIEGVTLLRSPMWQLHPVLCRNVTVRGVTLDADGFNTDGCNPESCTDVLIEDCSFNTGDDCIAIKSGRNGDGRRIAVPTSNVVIRRCHMKNGHGGVTIGSEISGGVHHVFAEDCRMDSPRLDHAIRFKNNAIRGGLLEHIYCRRIAVGKVGIALLNIDFNYEEGAHGPFTPVLRDVVLEEITGTAAPQVAHVLGLPGAPIGTVVIRNSSFSDVRKPSVVKYADLVLDNVRVNGKRVTSL
jgi:polygalacturonase